MLWIVSRAARNSTEGVRVRVRVGAKLGASFSFIASWVDNYLMRCVFVCKQLNHQQDIGVHSTGI